MSKYNLSTWFVQKFFWNHELKQICQMLTEMFPTVYSDFDFFRPLNWHKQAVMSAMPEKDVIK